MGFIVLEGGAEFSGPMAEVDREAIRLAGGLKVPIRIIPAAAAPDGNHRRAGQNGVDWFRQLGASDVSAPALIDRQSADDPEIAAELARARLIFLLGGFPHHLGQTLQGSKSWQAMLAAYASGAVIAGSSAGAMVLCETYYDPATSLLQGGLALVGGVCVLPHHDTFGKDWAPLIKSRRRPIVMIGIDEQTGAVSGSTANCWQVYGQGKVTLYRNNTIHPFNARQTFTLPVMQ